MTSISGRGGPPARRTPGQPGCSCVRPGVSRGWPRGTTTHLVIRLDVGQRSPRADTPSTGSGRCQVLTPVDGGTAPTSACTVTGYLGDALRPSITSRRNGRTVAANSAGRTPPRHRPPVVSGVRRCPPPRSTTRWWEETYNVIRPHHALGYEIPRTPLRSRQCSDISSKDKALPPAAEFVALVEGFRRSMAAEGRLTGGQISPEECRRMDCVPQRGVHLSRQQGPRP